MLVTSVGAKKGSFLGPYLSQKGELEENWTNMKFDTITIMRPGLLDRGSKMRTVNVFFFGRKRQRNFKCKLIFSKVEKISAFFSSAIPCDVIGEAIAGRVDNVVQSGAKEEEPMFQHNNEIYQQAELSRKQTSKL